MNVDHHHNTQSATHGENPGQAPQDPVYFDAILQPNRSLSPEGFRVLMIVFSVLLLGVGAWFYSLGAWPVLGFLGLEVAFVYWCFKQNYKSGRTYDSVHLTDQQLTVDRRNHWGEHKQWVFQPYWLNVDLKEPVEHDSQIRLRSHGRAITIGCFLAPEERAEFAAALRRALREAQAPSFHHAGE